MQRERAIEKKCESTEREKSQIRGSESLLHRM